MAVLTILHLVFVLIGFDQVSSVDVDGVKYFISESSKTWENARIDCALKKGRLAVILDNRTQEAIAFEMRRTVATETWIAGRIKHVDWQWTDGTVVAPQGCWADQLLVHDLKTAMGNVSVTPGECIQKCNTFKYAGIQAFENDKTNKLCYCGDSYGEYGPSDNCDQPCSDPAFPNCGGVSVNSIFAVYGGWATWALKQPTTYSPLPLCGIASRLQSYSYEGTPCNNTWYYMCQLDISQCNGKENDRYYKRLGLMCMYLGSVRKTWFDARKSCMSMGGDILKIDNYTQFMMLTVAMEDSNLGPQFYIGLSNMQWKWVDSFGHDIVYANWDPDHLRIANGECVHMARKAGYKWSNSDCNIKRRYVCQIGFRSPTNPPIPVNSNLFSTMFPGIITTSPPSAASPSAEGLVAITIIMTIAAIVGVSTAIYCHYKRNTERFSAKAVDQTSASSPGNFDTSPILGDGNYGSVG